MQNETNQEFQDYFNRAAAPVRVGIFAVGLETYWPQFDRLLETLIKHHKRFVEQLGRLGVEVVDAGVVDNSAKAYAAGNALNAAQVDLLICNVFTYSVSSNVLPVVQRVAKPLLLAGLQPSERMDYAKCTTWNQLANDNVTSLPEISCAVQRAGMSVADIIVGTLENDARAWKRIEQWTQVGRCLNGLRDAKIGLMGHVYEGMLDMNSDPTMFDGKFGMHVEHIELDDLQQRVDAVSDAAAAERLALIRKLFYFPPPGSDPIAGEVDADELAWSARVSLGMERLVSDFNLSGLAYYYRGLNGNAAERLGCSLTIGSSLLTGRGIPVAGEYDLKNCTAMLIMDRIGAGGSFAELHPADFVDDFVLVGHDGPHHIGIAHGRPVLRGLKVLHGKRGRGPGLEFAIKNGPITMLGLTQTADGKFKFVVAEGESVPGAIPATGNTNTRGRFKPDVRSFVEQWSLAGPTHHFALGVGHQAAVLEKLARVLGIECTVIARG